MSQEDCLDPGGFALEAVKYDGREATGFLRWRLASPREDYGRLHAFQMRP